MIGLQSLGMSKQAVMLVVDVGHSMDQAFSQSASRAKIALECCKLTLQQKIFNNSSHELGLTIFGDNDSDDGNSLLLQPIEKPSVSFVRKIEQLSHATFGNTVSGGDIFSALNYNLKVLNEHVKTRKYNKRMFLFSNGSGQSAFSLEEIPTLARKLASSNIKLNIIPIDFMVSYDCETNQLQGQMLLDKVQEENAQMLMRLKKQASDYVQIFPASIAIELYKRFRKKDTSPVARYKGKLEFAPGLEIEVSTYKAIRRQRLKSLARYDTSVPFDPIIPKEKEIILENNYTIQGDQTGEIVDKENIINAYNYGPQLVPISPILEAGSKIFEDKNLRLLGFIPKSKVPRHAFISDVDIVVPGTDDPTSRKLFSAFIYSTISLNKYGLARYVPRNSKNGVSPKMVVLIPYRSREREHFYLLELPTVEDIRQYPFNSLKKATTQQQQLVKDLVNRMSLVDGEEQLLKVQNTFNPHRQYFYQSIFYRAINDVEQLPPLDPVIKKYMNVEERIYPKTTEIMEKMRKGFKLNRKLNLVDKSDKKKAIIWKDVIDELSTKEDSGVIKEEAMEIEEEFEYVKPDNKLFEDDPSEMNFNPSAPILSFRKMVNYNKEDLVATALKSIKNYIENKLPFAITNQTYKHLTDCAAEMRTACVSQQEEKEWDSWLADVRERNGDFWHQLKKEGLGFIKESNTQVFKKEEKDRDEVLEDVICDLD